MFYSIFQMFKKKKMNSSLFLKLKKNKTQSNKQKKFFQEEIDFSSEIQKLKNQFINKEVLKNLINQKENRIKIKLIKKPNILLRNLSLEKECLKTKKIDNNSAIETTITIECNSNNFINHQTNYNLNSIHKKNNLISKNNLFQNINNISKSKIKKNIFF